MFESLILIKPFWYFHWPCGERSFWPDPDILNSEISLDIKYDSHKSAILESSFLLLLNGWLPKNSNRELSFDEMEYKPSIHDEFRFLRKHFHPGWSVIYLLYCIFTLRNPIRIFQEFFKTIIIKRQLLFSEPIGITEIPDGIDIFQLIHQKVSIRIVIPTYNRYDVLDDVLKDLEQQDYIYFSVTVVDQSDPFDRSFYDKYKLNIKLIRQESPGLWRARNRAIQQSNEVLIALLDDDSRLTPNWLRKHLQCLDYFGAMISAGVSISTRGAKVPDNYSFYRLSDQLDTGNVVLFRTVFETCGLFDEQFEGMRMGDGEFGLRTHKAGFLSISNPEGKRVHLKVEQGGLRQMGSWDAMRPTNIFKPRPIPSVLYLANLHFEKSVALRYILISIPFSLSPYSWKSTLKGVTLSLFLFFLFLPIVVLQVLRSWLIACSLTREGPKIDHLMP